MFGRRLVPPSAEKVSASPSLSRLLIPRGAVESARQWSLAEALGLFVDHAIEDALFEPSELPRDAVDVLAAYRCAGELDNRPLSDWRARQDQVALTTAARGFGLIGRSHLADLIVAGDDTSPPTDSSDVAESVSQWVRHSPDLLVLGDGGSDTHYKEVMKALWRTNPRYAMRAAPPRRLTARQRERQAMVEESTPLSLEALIDDTAPGD